MKFQLGGGGGVMKACTTILSCTLLPIARPRPQGTAAASTSPTYGLRLFLALEKLIFPCHVYHMRKVIKQTVN